jgi:Tol biopolymer transport system component
LLRKNRDERYQSARDLLGDLKNLKQELELDERLANGAGPIAAAAVTQTGEQLNGGPATETVSTPPTTSAEYLVREISEHRRGAALVLTLLLIAVAGGGTWLYRTWSRAHASGTAPWPQVALHRFATHGGVPYRTVIAPNGKSLAYVQRLNGRDSLWLGQIETNSSVLISDQPDLSYLAIAFAPDGESIYLTAREFASPRSKLLRVPLLGGVMTELNPAIDSAVTFSPDGRSIAFLRRDDKNNQIAIIVAGVDSKNERLVTQRERPESFSSEGLAWSPDGKRIAVGLGSAQGQLEIVTVDIADGSISKISRRTWGALGNLVWLPEGNAILAMARDADVARRSQLWLVTYPEGESRKITNDLDIYTIETLSMSANGTLAVMQGHQTSEIWVAPDGDVKRAQRALQGAEPRYEGIDGLAWTPNGHLLYSAYVEDGQAIFRMDQNGADLRQLTTNPTDIVDREMTTTNDGSYIVFQSNRSGSFQIWRANSDGSSAKQLTSAGTCVRPSLSPDGKWIVYAAERDGKSTLWRISIDGADAKQLTTNSSAVPQVSPDGKYIAFLESTETQPLHLAIIEFDGGPALKTFALPSRPPVNLARRLRWTPDGTALLYKDSVQGLWRQRLDKQAPQPVKGFQDILISQMAWSPDGKSLAYTSQNSMRDIILLQNIK